MSKYTQDNRLIGIDTPLGKDVLLLRSFRGVERISSLFTFQLELLALKDDVDFSQLIGQNVTIRVTLADGSERYVNGHVSRFAQLGTAAEFTTYSMEVVPWLWFLTRIVDCRIFQNKTIPEIIEAVFKSRGMKDFKSSVAAQSFAKREYCVQYRETDFNFVSRLMEQYGIFYHFEHEKQRHTLVMADSPSSYKDCPGQPKARYNLSTGDLDMEDVITGWQLEQELRSGKFSLRDYNFETPSANLFANEPSVVRVGGNDQFEIYDYPGIYLNQGDGRSVAKIRMQERETGHLVARGNSVCRSLASGYTLSLEEHPTPSMNQKYLLMEIEHQATVGDSYFHDDAGGAEYKNKFACIPVDAKLPFRPAHSTPRPFVHGPQTAIVVGPKDEEIYVDKYGRVKVQFYWDRQGEENEKSSCWIRVSQAWAGKNWGAMWIPRIGQEVIVDFLEGDPDRPIITGRVYNAEQMPPYQLPDHHTRSTFMSRSSKEGGTPNYNELRFEDKKGKEQIFMNAERDMDHRVEHDSREYIGSNRHLIVNSSQFELVGGNKHGHVKGNYNELIEGNQSLSVYGNCMERVAGTHSVEIDGDRKELITGNDSRVVAGSLKEEVAGSASLMVVGNQMETVMGSVSRIVADNIAETAAGGFSREVAQSSNQLCGEDYNVTAGMSVNMQGGMKVLVQAGMEICLTGPGGFISISPAGVTIEGVMVRINSGGAPTPAAMAKPSPPSGPEKPDLPDSPASPTEPETADDGSKGGKL